MNEIEKTPLRKRRVRYKGTFPKKFAEKYKEHNPEKYGTESDKVKARGQTPVGTHRPICVTEILDALAIQPGYIGVDATLGYGGHSEAILEKIAPNGKLFGLDVDTIEMPKTEARLRQKGFSSEIFIARRMNFAGILSLLSEAPGGFDFIVADLGVSSMQLDNPERGFSFKTGGPLDLRLNPAKGTSACDLLKTLSIDELAQILRENADEPYALKLAKAMVANKNSIETTLHLATLIKNTLKGTGKQGASAQDIKKTTQRVFQALRIAVNKEFEVLEEFLERVPRCLKPGGRLAILTFHSGEDRRVKKSFQEGLANELYSYISPTPLRPSKTEQFENPRSIPAKLRVAVKK